VFINVETLNILLFTVYCHGRLAICKRREQNCNIVGQYCNVARKQENIRFDVRRCADWSIKFPAIFRRVKACGVFGDVAVIHVESCVACVRFSVSTFVLLVFLFAVNLSVHWSRWNCEYNFNILWYDMTCIAL
jgi:hypothetical protein